MHPTLQNTKKTILVVLAFMGILIAGMYAAQYISNNPESQETIAQFGYFGVFIVAVIAGINVFAPLPAASFVPIFTEAGLWLPAIIFILTIGTLVADYLGYLLGNVSRPNIRKKYPQVLDRIERIHTNHANYIPYLIFTYSAFMPFPNEAMILPLAVTGMPFYKMLIPLFLGNLLNQTLFSYGIQNIFLLFF